MPDALDILFEPGGSTEPDPAFRSEMTGARGGRPRGMRIWWLGLAVLGSAWCCRARF